MKCPDSFGIYQAMIVLDIPSHMLQNSGGYYSTKNKVSIDQCIVEEIKYLWENNIHTYHCCCGHGVRKGNVIVDKKDTNKMKKLGYVIDKESNKDGCFYLKSLHQN